MSVLRLMGAVGCPVWLPDAELLGKLREAERDGLIYGLGEMWALTAEGARVRAREEFPYARRGPGGSVPARLYEESRS